MSLESSIINSRYTIGTKIGSGSFGTIYNAFDNQTNKKVALKLESTKSDHQQLYHEKSIYRKLKGNNENGIPEIYDYFKDYKLPDGNYNILVMQLVGSSLEDLFDKCNRKFSLKTTLQLAIQLIKRIQYIHSCSFLHRDIKPDNFLFNNNTVYAIDFGLSKLYRDPKTHSHIQYRDDKSLTGTPRYASINTHQGCEQARRDDLEAIGYVLVYFLQGKLPWQGLQAANKKKKYRKIMEMKIGTSLESLCRKLPSEFITYLEYVKGLNFADKPDYEYLIKLFLRCASKNNIKLDDQYDWDIISKKEIIPAVKIIRSKIDKGKATKEEVQEIADLDFDITSSSSSF